LLELLGSGDAVPTGGPASLCDWRRLGVVERIVETGATGLEPATSGVTDHARGITILHQMARKSPISRDFGEA
jgi:hypothetical protein